MAGHSKFKNIQFRKGKQDKLRSKLFSKLSRDITLAAKGGIPDPSANARLRLAIAAARQNAAARDIHNGEFIAAQVEDVLPELLKKFSAAQTAVILDPPRKGCWPETLELLRQMRPAQVIYVSCHPATMARDLNILCADGVFELARVQPLDMFPQTQHVECVADLRRRN